MANSLLPGSPLKIQWDSATCIQPSNRCLVDAMIGTAAKFQK